MRSKILCKSLLLLVAILALGCATWAQSVDAVVDPVSKTLTITLKGLLGPILTGSDPLGLNGLHGTVTIMASESLNPKKHTDTSATYMLPAGAVTVKAGTNEFTTTSPSKFVINLTSTADIFKVIAAGPSGLVATATTFIKAGSWTTDVLKHPTVFTPSPQKLKSAKKAGGPGCQVKYTIFSSTTVLGFKGTGSSKDALDPMLP